MISKELLSEILNNGVTHVMIDLDIDNDVEIWFNDDTIGSINIYELAYRCKEWAFRLDTTMITSSISEAFMGIASIRDDNGNILFCEVCDSEPEAIFKACQYILENR